MKLLRGLTTLFVLLAVACTGTETGNPSADTQLTLRARSADSQVVTIGTDQGRIRVTAAWVSLGPISLVACDAAASEVLRPIAEDIVAAPAPRAFETEGDVYCGLGTRYDRASGELPGGAPVELPGRSLVVIGQRNDGVGFRLATELSAPVSLAATAPGFSVDALEHSLILAFDLASWFDTVDLTVATLETDGSIRVDAQRNPALLGAFDAGIGGSATLHHDIDHDGELDADELAVLAH